MKLIVQIKFGSEKQKLVKFGDFRYLIYVCFKKEESRAMEKFKEIMSKEMGIPPNRIKYLEKKGENYIFEVE